MNIKSLLTLATLTAAGTAAAAAVTSQNTLCRIQIDSSAESTIVAVPLAKVGGGDIPVDQLVLTDNLEKGDTLLHWNGTSSSWEAWIIDVNHAWRAVTTVEAEELNYAVPDPDSTSALARGDAIWVNRSNTSKSFYIYGQVATGGGTTVVAKGSAEAPAYTMMAAPTTDKDGFQLNTLVDKIKVDEKNETVGEFADGDMIVVSNPSDETFGRTEYVYKSDCNNFCTRTAETKKVTVGGQEYTVPTGKYTYSVVADKVMIPVGEGFWYVSKGGNPTIAW